MPFKWNKFSEVKPPYDQMILLLYLPSIFKLVHYVRGYNGGADYLSSGERDGWLLGAIDNHPDKLYWFQIDSIPLPGESIPPLEDPNVSAA